MTYARQAGYIGITKATYNTTAKVVDFNVPAAGAPTTGLAFVNRQFVTIDACRKCHGPELANAAHGGSYYDTSSVSSVTPGRGDRRGRDERESTGGESFPSFSVAAGYRIARGELDGFGSWPAPIRRIARIA